MRQVPHHAFHDLLAQPAFHLAAEGRVEGRRFQPVDAALPRPGGQGRGAAGRPIPGGPYPVDLVQLGDQFQFDRRDTGDLRGEFGRHRGRHGQHRRRADARSDGGRTGGRARDELVREFLGAQARELPTQRGEVPYGDPGGDVDDPVGEVPQRGPGAAGGAVDAAAGGLGRPAADRRRSAPGCGRGPYRRGGRFTAPGHLVERGRSRRCLRIRPFGRPGRSPLAVTRAVRAVERLRVVRSPAGEAALPRRGRAGHGRPCLSRSRGRSAGRSSHGPADCGGAPGSSSCR